MITFIYFTQATYSKYLLNEIETIVRCHIFSVYQKVGQMLLPWSRERGPLLYSPGGKKLGPYQLFAL